MTNAPKSPADGNTVRDRIACDGIACNRIACDRIVCDRIACDRIACVLLAAGAGKRFGGQGEKLLWEADGKSMLSRAVSLFGSFPFAEKVCVVRKDAVTVRSLAEESGFFPAINENPSRGVGSSVAVGVRAARERAACPDGILFAVCDQPWLTAGSVRRLIGTFLSDGSRICALSYHGVRGNPAIFPAALFGELEALTGDVGGGAVIRRHPALLTLVEADSAAELTDVDAPISE